MAVTLFARHCKGYGVQSGAEEDYAIGMAKNSPLEDAVNSVLEELKADGTLQAIVDKYITAE